MVHNNSTPLTKGIAKIVGISSSALSLTARSKVVLFNSHGPPCFSADPVITVSAVRPILCSPY